METFDGIPTFYARTRAEWRGWLADHCRSEKRICLILYHKDSPTPSVRFTEAIEEAICFGWIDSKGKRRTADSAYLCFSRRNPKSPWGRTTRERALKLTREGLMTEEGQASVDLARKTGTWDALVDAQSDIIPADLRRRLAKDRSALESFRSMPPSHRKVVLEWIARAKKPETRLRRIERAVRQAAESGRRRGRKDRS